MKTYITSCISLLLLASSLTVRAHEHLAIGADNSGTLILFDENNNPMNATNPDTYHMIWTPVGQNYGGYYSLGEIPRYLYPDDYFVFTALSDGQAELDGPDHAPTGADIWMEISSVTGPTGSHFGYWEAGTSNFSSTPTASLLADGSSLNFRFEISEPLPGQPADEQDPYGHIHDRGFTVDQPGDYYVTFTIYDESGLGPDGGPLAATSEPYTFHFVAVPEPSVLGLGAVALAVAGWSRLRSRREPVRG